MNLLKSLKPKTVETGETMKPRIKDRVIKEMYKLTEWEQQCVEEGIRLTEEFVMEDVIQMIKRDINKIKEQRRNEDYTTLSNGFKDCPEGCGDEGLYHQQQILEELLRKLKPQKEGK